MISTEANTLECRNSNKLSHAYIASGALADSLAMSAVCSGVGKRPCMKCTHCDKSSRGLHPDITIIKKQDKKREIRIEQIRELKTDVIVVPNEADKKAYVINDADSMNENAQNALLRMLEEPPSHAVFILKTSSPAQLLQTVRSRCVELKSKTADTQPDSEITELVKSFFSALSKGDLELVKLMFRLEKLDKELFDVFLTAARDQAAEKLRISSPDGTAVARDILSHTERILAKAGEYLDLNVSTGHISGMICASICELRSQGDQPRVKS